MGKAMTNTPAPEPLAVSRYRHKKRGTVYTLIGVGRAQGTLNDDDPVVLYRGEDGGLWARHQAEFCDGRFEEICRLAATRAGSGVREKCRSCGMGFSKEFYPLCRYCGQRDAVPPPPGTECVWPAGHDVGEVEVEALKAAIFGSDDYDQSLKIGNFIEMVRATEAGRQGALARATKAEAGVEMLREAVQALVSKLEQSGRCDLFEGKCGIPNFGDELEALREALRASDGSA